MFTYLMPPHQLRTETNVYKMFELILPIKPNRIHQDNRIKTNPIWLGKEARFNVAVNASLDQDREGCSIKGLNFRVGKTAHPS